MMSWGRQFGLKPRWTLQAGSRATSFPISLNGFMNKMRIRRREGRDLAAAADRAYRMKQDEGRSLGPLPTRGDVLMELLLLIL